MGKYLDMTGLTYLMSKIIALINAKSDKNHTHNYAGSSSAGGAATTALTCTGNSATATNSDMLDGLHASDIQKSMVNLAKNTNVLEYADNYPVTQTGGTMFTYRVINGYNEPFAENIIGSGDYYYYANKSHWIFHVVMN